mmetsp:Transcript_62319/g.147696  ORF Transcript_62319/g.147696 Transcript_62319/m.147696 type:complete len:225 (-) Transcript_62319:1340-2014(-)
MNAVRSAAKLLDNGLVETVVVETKGDTAVEEKRAWLETMLAGGWHAYEFFEEVYRVVPEWELTRYPFPIFRVQSFAKWPESQRYQDHIFVKDTLPLPKQPDLTFLFPPTDFVFWNPKRAALLLAIRAFASSEGKVRLFVNDQAAGEYVFGEGDVKDYNTFHIALPELPGGQHVVAAQLIDTHGEDVGQDAEVTFVVDETAPAPREPPHWYYSLYGGQDAMRPTG